MNAMNSPTHVDKPAQQEKQSIQKPAEAHNPHAQVAHASPQIAQLNAYTAIANNPHTPTHPVNGGLPTQLQSGVESLSGIAMRDVRVHYNSSKPAQLQAHAYAQGSDIHLAPGQEKHLPHEAWHVVQQKQGRVKPTLQLKGVAINDDSTLEREADVMGGKASLSPAKTIAIPADSSHGHLLQNVSQRKAIEAAHGAVAQRTVVIASQKVNTEKALEAKDATNYDPALLVAAFEAAKFSGGPVKLLSNIGGDDVKDKAEVAIVGHGTGTNETGGIAITTIAQHLAGKQFGAPPVAQGQKRKAHVNLFSCISASEIDDEIPADAGAYKTAFSNNNIDATILAPKGIAVPGLSADPNQFKMTSIRLNQTAVNVARTQYERIKSYWVKVKQLESMQAPDQTFSQIADSFTAPDAKWDDVAVKAMVKKVVAWNTRGLATNDALRNKVTGLGVADAKIAAELPNTLKVLIENPVGAVQTAICNAILTDFESNYRKHRLPTVGLESLLPEFDAKRQLLTDLTEYQESFAQGDEQLENSSGQQLPASATMYSTKVGNLGNWAFM
jgi:hypothetical protein